MDILIFITVGTSKLAFNRLLKIVDELCDERVLNKADIFAQIGFSTYKPRNYKYVKFVDREEHHRIIEEAEYIITHAGTGSVISSLKLEKKIIVFPRLSMYGEHVDDHQLELADFFCENKYVLQANNKEEMVNAVNVIKKFESEKFFSNNERINNLIIEFIQSLYY